MTAPTKHYRFALFLLVAATFFTGLAGVFPRHVEAAEGWAVLFYRSPSFAALLAWLVVRAAVRLAVDEEPGDLTFIGGSIVLAAAGAHGALARRRQASSVSV